MLGRNPTYIFTFNHIHLFFGLLLLFCYAYLFKITLINMTLSHNINHIQKLIRQTTESCHRASDSVLLLAVSKQHSALDIEEAVRSGLTQFGENYYQEAEAKIRQLRHLKISWHFIGPIQSNKTKGIAAHFDWVHSINRFSIAERLSHYRPLELAPLNVCLQVNVIPETSKAGIGSEEALDLARAVTQLPNLTLRGLMTIPPLQHNPEAQYEVFARLRDLMHSLNHQLGLKMDTLSMGMSDDMVPAIEAGATIVRVGRAIFGERIRGNLL